MFVAVSERDLTIYGIGITEKEAVLDAKESCFHSLHPVTLNMDSCTTLEVVNLKLLKKPLNDDELLNLEVVPFAEGGVKKCKLVQHETH